MTRSGFDAGDLTDLYASLTRLANEQYPREAKSFLRSQGNKARTRLRNKTKSVTKKKTGNLLKGIDKRQPKLYQGSFQIRVYNKAPHAHLIEHGHVMADKFGNPILNEFGQEMWVNGRFPAAQTTNELKAIWPGEVEKFIDDLIDKGLG